MDIIEAAKHFENVGKDVLRAYDVKIKCSCGMVAIASTCKADGGLEVAMLPEIAFIEMVQDAIDESELGELDLSQAMTDSFIETSMA